MESALKYNGLWKYICSGKNALNQVGIERRNSFGTLIILVIEEMHIPIENGLNAWSNYIRL